MNDYLGCLSVPSLNFAAAAAHQQEIDNQRAAIKRLFELLKKQETKHKYELQKLDKIRSEEQAKWQSEVKALRLMQETQQSEMAVQRALPEEVQFVAAIKPSQHIQDTLEKFQR